MKGQQTDGGKSGCIAPHAPVNVCVSLVFEYRGKEPCILYTGKSDVIPLTSWDVT